MATGTLGAATPLNASDDNRLLFTQDTTETQSVALDDTAADFLDMQSLDWTVEYRQSGLGDDTVSLGIRIMDSGGTTVLAAEDSGGTFVIVNADVQNTTDTTTGPTGFAYVNGTANKSTWDGAVVELQQTYTQNMGKDGVRIEVDHASFDATYTANEIVNGSPATTAVTTSAGSINVVNNVQGVTATTTATSNAGNTFVEKEIQGSSASTTSTASAGDYLRTFIGSTAQTSDTANAGSIEAHYNLGGAQASETSTANVGSAVEVFGILGSTASTQAIGNSGDQEIYKVTGKLDEWGNFVLGGVDEWGSSYEVLENHNEWGDYLDLVAELDISKVPGAQALLVDTPNAGLALSGSDVGGEPASTTDTANAGSPAGVANVSGSTATTTDTPNAGTAFEDIPISGQASSTASAAHAGSIWIDVEVEGTGAESPSMVHFGNAFVAILEEGATVTTTETVTGSVGFIVYHGSPAATDSDAKSGSILLPGFIRVQGSKALMVDTPKSGSLGISELLVSGVPTYVSDIARKGKALGGIEKRKIMIDAQIRDRVTLAV